MRQFERGLLWLFFFLIFVVHYQTTWSSGTLHSWVLVMGFAITMPLVAVETINANYAISKDYAIGLGMLVLLILGFAVNLGRADSFYFKTHLISFACYAFVRHGMRGVSLRRVEQLVAWFLLLNSVLMILQLVTGRFYVAWWLAAGNPPLAIPSGFADGPTKNGMLHGAALSLVFARLIVSRPRLVSLESIALALGGLTLLLTLSRASVAGVAVAVVAVAFLSGRIRRRSGIRRHSSTRFRQRAGIVVALVVVFGTAAAGVTYLKSRSGESRNSAWLASVLSYKFLPQVGKSGEFKDASLNTRLATARAVGLYLLENPLYLALGTGPGTFERIYAEVAPTLRDTGAVLMRDVSTHNSYLEVLVEGGALLLVALLVLIWHVVAKAFRRPDALEILPFLGWLVSTMVFMAFHDVIRGRIFWIPLAVVAAFAYAQQLAGDRKLVLR